MVVDKIYCMNSFLIFRYVVDENKTFKAGLERPVYALPEKEYAIHSAADIDAAIRDTIIPIADEHTGIMLSGGMDSAILASYLPAGVKAYTLECQAEGAKRETREARYFADRCGLEHHIIKITWEDYQNYTQICMKQKGAPVHSIEPMIYKAAMRAKNDGCTKLIFGENADIKFGGMDGLLSKNWTKDEFKNRYTYVNQLKVLKQAVDITEPFDIFEKQGYYDAHGFINKFFLTEAHNTYSNACKSAGVEYVTPYVYMNLAEPLDLQRIRAGESKYLIRELFAKRYPDSIPAVKLPMPRAVGMWLKDWKGPVRNEFLPNCTEGLTGDQKWYVYVLEWFLNMIESGE